ncbi:helicase-related protein [Bacillales bacterium AN1005]
MRNKEIKLLITTTILERGVTFPNIDVAVLGAEDAVFTASALIQIAGRAGRSVKNPFGDVAFFITEKRKVWLRQNSRLPTVIRKQQKRVCSCLGWEEENELYDLLKLIKASFKLD